MTTTATKATYTVEQVSTDTGTEVVTVILRTNIASRAQSAREAARARLPRGGSDWIRVRTC